MSQDETKLSRKERRAQRDASRFRKSKKPKGAESNDAELSTLSENLVTPTPGLHTIAVPPEADHNEEQPNNPSKKRKRPQEALTSQKGSGTSQEVERLYPHKTIRIDSPAGKTRDSAKPIRFICFIGNLPWNTTDKSLEQHFKKLQPFTLRHRVDKATGKSKGFAFLEFDSYDRMNTCLKQYHHSTFDPDSATRQEDEVISSRMRDLKDGSIKRALGGRKINVELTAGSGGTGEARMEKIRRKNEKLDAQRKRKLNEDRREKKRTGYNDRKGVADAKSVSVQQKSKPIRADVDGIHPARLARMQA